jgi:transcriptional regulator with XRE-family HTH domain
MVDPELLYRAVGRKIREARERSSGKITQQGLAARIGISRASVVNIEAGRQRAPLHLLWGIADALDTDLSLLLPSQQELNPGDREPQLDASILAQIQLEFTGDPDAQRAFGDVVSKLKAIIGATRTREAS